jgi:hypothetical protein
MKHVIAHTPMTYEAWMRAVDALAVAKYGIGTEDACDWMSRDAYDDGMSPRQGLAVFRAELEDMGYIVRY